LDLPLLKQPLLQACLFGPAAHVPRRIPDQFGAGMERGTI
jgi:hypothetical protein